MVGIIDYGAGNLGSVKAILERMSIDYLITSDILLLEKCTHVILPGVGSFKTVSETLHKNINVKKLVKLVKEKAFKILGICIGMQLLAEYGEEGGGAKGLALIKGNVKSLKYVIDENIRLPHMGWNNLIVKKDHLSTFSELNNLDFYHVHTYYFEVFNKKHIIATVDYGIEIPSFIRRDNIFGAQFHPEKSQKNGIKFLNYFLNS
jgi:glutamine amidotransferase